MNYQYITNFAKSRQNRIGASDIPHLIPHPEKQSESLAAYTDSKGVRHACTALDLYESKVNGKPWEYSFPATMGHRLEGYALYEFIADNISKDIAIDFLRGYQEYKLSVEDGSALPADIFNKTPFKHNTEATNDYGVAHADCVYDDPDNSWSAVLESPIIKKNGLTIDLSKPFVLEAKSANIYSVWARKKDPYKGYDIELKTHQGIPLAHYMQVQFQMHLYNIDVAYVSLIYNTNSKHYWQIKANRKHQKELIQLASYMKKCIDTKTPPKNLLMNSKDILNLYENNIKDGDFREVKGDELVEVLEIAKIEGDAKENEKRWKTIKEDAAERMSIHLKETEQLKGIINGSMRTIAKWKSTGGGSRLMGLKEIKEREDNKRLIRYLNKNDLIKESEKKRKATVVIKREEIE